MTREEMIAKARETRKQVMSAVVPQELLDRYPAVVEKLEVGTSVGTVDVYDTMAQSEPGSPRTMAQSEPGSPRTMAQSEPGSHRTMIVNLHGGGFIRERTANDEVFCRKISYALGCHVLDVDYSIAPDYPFPQALYECYEVCCWAAEHADDFGADKDKIVLMGHSAGGNLVCGINLLLKEEKEKGNELPFEPMMNIIDYPPLDLYTDPGAKKCMGVGIPPERARLYNLYYADADQLKNPLVSPYYAEEEQLKEFPPTLVMTAGTDTLCNEAEEFGLKLARAGAKVTMKRFQGAKHGFTIYRTDKCDEGVNMIIDFIRKESL